MLNCHPLIQGMYRMKDISPYFQLSVNWAEGEGWISAYDLFHNDDNRLINMVRNYGIEHWNSSNPHVAGSAFLIAYLTRLVWPVIGQYVLEKVVRNQWISSCFNSAHSSTDLRRC